MTAYNPIPPTRLYYKKCSHCELKYYGKSVKQNLEKYKGSGKRWVRHLKKHNATSIHIWNSEWFYDTSIIEVAMKFSIKNNIIESDEWANLAIENGVDGGYLGEKVIEKSLKTKSDPLWKDTVGKKQTEKMLKTKSDPLWKDTVGKKSKEKMLKTKADSVWKETVGKEAKDKELKTKSDPVWQETVGKKTNEKISKTMCDPLWKEKNAKVCPHCSVKIDSANYAKWHGDKCRHKPNTFIESINL